MSWIDWLEARIGFLAIPRLVPMVAILNGIVFLLSRLEPTYLDFLALKPRLVLHGQVWRLVTHLFIPQYFSRFDSSFLGALFFFVYVMFMIWIGNSLEQAWGAFRLTLYYLFGAIGVTVAAFILNTPQVGDSDPAFFLNLSLFFAFATLFPNVEIYAFFFFPIQVKWLALISLVPLLIQVLFGEILGKIAILVSLANYLVFFGPSAFTNLRQSRKVQKRRTEFTARSVAESEPLHRCAVCQRTEQDHPELEFRVARDGEEYCLTHLPR